MSLVSNAHFGGNIILTRDSLTDGQPFAETLKEIEFSGFRYPGGGVAEDQTWENGGLDRMFGAPMTPGSDNYVLTINEALSYSAETGKPLTIVTPTFQFFNKATNSFDHVGFDRYLEKLEAALRAHPGAKINGFEIGNEYWGSKLWGSLTAGQYGKIANVQVPKLDAMVERISGDLGVWQKPGIGVQAGVQWQAEQGLDGRWTAVGPRDSSEMISQISMKHRAMIDTIFQHSYPDASSITQNLNWALRPMEVFKSAPGFSPDIKFTLSEFNIGANSAVGIDQGAAWIDAFSQAVDQGIDAINHWGIAYGSLSNKFYDTYFPASESAGGKIAAIATPMGQVYDIAQSHLVGKTTMPDSEALAWVKASAGVGVTGFKDKTQEVLFFHNGTPGAGTINLDDIPEGMHVSLRILKPANSPHTDYDESARLPGPNGIADARGDMKVISGPGLHDAYQIQPGEMYVVIISDPDRPLVIEGAHNVTDPGTGMVDDLIVGGRGNDILRGHVGNDTLMGGGGRNVMSGGSGDDFFRGSNDGDVIFSDGGRDTVVAGKGNDLIFARSPDDKGASQILGGGGRDVFLVGGGTNATIQDFTADDYIGFGGAFADADALRDASTVSGKNLIVQMPDGSRVVLEGQAEQINGLEDQVLDFMDQDQIWDITDTYLEGLSYEQILEIFQQKDAGFDQSDDNESRYFDELEALLDRLEIENPAQADDDENSALPSAPDGTLPEEDRDHPGNEKDNDEDEDDDDGSCFVATAAFGDSRHPDVVALRAFRDNHLVKTQLGRAFVRLYWLVGPKLAAVTRPDDVHALAARSVLSRLVRLLRAVHLTAGR